MQFRQVCLTLILALTTFSAAATAAPVKFDIPAQPAASALMAFSKQARVEVVFSPDDLKSVQTPAVRGELEPEEALAVLLKDSGFAAIRNDGGKFVVTREKPRAAPAVTGTVVNEDTGNPVAGARVRVVDSAVIAFTDRSGRFRLDDVPAGTQSVVILADDYAPTRVTDVNARAGAVASVGEVVLRPRKDGVTKLEEYVVSAQKDVVELENLEVSGNKVKPFAEGNVDIPRMIDDVQPYYIFDAKAIEQSGSINLEDFLRRRLTMNTTARTASDANSSYVGTSSSVSLRGLGADSTLVLVNGRRIAGVGYGSVESQPDLNGIPFALIERVEVLPASASGIYGGSAVGGVINVVLKKRFSGGELRAGYDNTFDTDTARRSASLTYGFQLENGRTQVLLNASWADGHLMMAQDRPEIFANNAALLLKNYPAMFSSTALPLLGALPNIVATSAAVTNLKLKNGSFLGARKTYVAAGTSSSTSASDLYASLLANAGSWNTDPPATMQYYTGTRRVFTVPPITNSFAARIDRKMNSRFELFVDLTRSENNSRTPYFSALPLTVGASAPSNPFTTAVRVQVPAANEGHNESHVMTAAAVVGAIVHLPRDWTLELDYSQSFTRLRGVNDGDFDTQGMISDINSGLLNPFVDTLKYPLSLGKYDAFSSWAEDSHLGEWALRGFGPLSVLPWGAANVNFGLQHRRWWDNNANYINTFTASPANNNTTDYYPRKSTTDSAYVETLIPLVKKGWKPLLYGFDVQLSGRTERYTVDTGTSSKMTFPNTPPTPTVYFTGPTLPNGDPYFSRARYDSTSYTAGFRYQPVRAVTIRASTGTAFLPPTNAQLVPDPQPSTTPTNVTDPKTGTTAAVFTLAGGNPSVKPQHSKDRSIGIIWEPGVSLLQGLRVNAEYRETDQFDAITTLTAQQIVNLESLFPGRVTRNASGTITQVDTSYLNLYKRESRGWDFTLDYVRKTAVGTFGLNSITSLILHTRRQVSLTVPMYDYAGYNPAEGDGGAPKTKSNMTLTWERSRWSVGWTTRYVGSYKAYGAAGGPLSLQSAAGGVYSYYITAMGGKDTIGSQVYHDVFANYAFRQPTPGRGAFSGLAGLLDGVSVQVGVRNLFDRIMPLDASSNTLSYGYVSPYGDLRLRSYWITLKKAF
jgi:outer membrane receptor protein involved in Fe transport